MKDCDVVLNDIKTDEEYRCSFIFVVFPNGKTGYRLEYMKDDLMYPEDLGTIVVEDGKLRVVQW